MILLPVPYVAGTGPMAYAVGRNWVSGTTFEAYCRPLEEFYGQRNQRILMPEGLEDFIEWCHAVGRRHSASD